MYEYKDIAIIIAYMRVAFMIRNQIETCNKDGVFTCLFDIQCKYTSNKILFVKLLMTLEISLVRKRDLKNIENLCQSNGY